MSHNKQRPPSDFYADINNPAIDGAVLEGYSKVIADYAADLLLHTAAGLTTLELEPQLLQPKTNPEDYIVQIPTTTGIALHIIDRGNGLHDALKSKSGLDVNNPYLVRGKGLLANQILDDGLTHYDEDYVRIDSDGLALEALYHVIIDTKRRMAVYDLPDVGQALLDSGLCRVYARGLVFDETGSPQLINGDLEHRQYGLSTDHGFVPLVTVLDNKHPVVERIAAATAQK